MNKRQAKKAFKKRYGMNPNQMCKYFEKELPSAIKVLTERLPDIINEWHKTLIAAIETLQEKIREMNSEEFKEFLRQMSTQEKQDEGRGDRNEMVDEIDSVDLRGNAGHLPGHAGDHGSSRD